MCLCHADYKIKSKFYSRKIARIPTVVSHLAMVVGLCTDDPKDF